MDTEAEDQIMSIENQIEEAEKSRDEKLAALMDMTANRFEQVLSTWQGALGFDAAAEKLRVFIGSNSEISFQQLVVIRQSVYDHVKKMSDAYKDDSKKDDIDWTNWLDQWCNQSDGAYKSINSIVVELLILDVCQNIWMALRRIPEFSNAVDKEIGDMKSELEKIKAESTED